MFKLNLSEEVRAEIAQDNAELERLYGLTNQWLASALLKLARQAQASTPQYRPEDPTYNSRLVWGIVPELARRLGTVKLVLGEIDWEIRELSNYDLRLRIGITLANVGTEAHLPGWKMLSKEAVNGNPVVFGIDRLCPGNVTDLDDRLVRRAQEVARYRGVKYSGVWTPEFRKSSGF